MCMMLYFMPSAIPNPRHVFQIPHERHSPTFTCLVYPIVARQHLMHARSCRYPLLWMGLSELVGGAATMICIILMSLLFASTSYAVLRFDQMQRATLELALESEAICSQVRCKIKSSGSRHECTLLKLDDGWPESEEEQVRKFQLRRRCNEDSKEKNVKDDEYEYERRADVRCVDVKRAKVRCVEVRRADVRCEDVRRAHVRCEDVRRAAVRFYTQTLLQTDTFTHRHFYTQNSLHTDTFRHRHFYTHAFTHTHTLLQTETFTHKTVYTQTLYTQTLLHAEAFTHKTVCRGFYTQVPVHTNT